MIKLLITIIIMIASISVSATHNIGGTITYKHISGQTYETTVITYTDGGPSALADRDRLIILWGDGNSDTIFRVNQINIGNYILKNTYKGTHTYSSFGYFKISMSDPNRMGNIMNVPNSDTTCFYLESYISVTSANENNNSVDIISPEVFFFPVGKTLSYNITAYDIDGDNLSFELVNSKGIDGEDIAGYYVPDSISIDNISGEIKWNSPPTIGTYLLTIKISECRNGVKIGSVLIDIPVYITSPPSTNPTFLEMTNWQLDSNNNYSITIAPNDTFQLNIAIEAYSNPFELLAYGDPFLSPNNATFLSDSISITYERKIFKWTPNNINVRCTPYIVTFRGNILSSAVKKDVTLLIYVKDSSLVNCDYTCDLSLSANYNQIHQEKINVLIYPNPFNSVATISISGSDKEEYKSFNVYDIWGKEVRSIPICDQKEIMLFKNGLPSGIYIYHIMNERYSIVSGKLIID